MIRLRDVKLAAGKLVPKKRHKYNASPQRIDGYYFDSTAEGQRYGALKLRQVAGEIKDLQVHPRYPLELNGARVAIYEADFAYLENGRVIVEDVKGTMTEVARIKIAFFRAAYPHADFRIIGGGNSSNERAQWEATIRAAGKIA